MKYRSSINVGYWNIEGFKEGYTGKSIPKTSHEPVISVFNQYDIICIAETHVGAENTAELKSKIFTLWLGAGQKRKKPNDIPVA